MKRTILTIVLAAAVVLQTTTSAEAFDGSRRGFVLGGGLGGGLSSFTQELTIESITFESDRENRAALVTDFHIGGGLSETLVLTYSARVSWFGIETLGGDVTIASGSGVVALTKYSRPTAPSTFVRGGVGFSTWDTPLESNSGDAATGLGLSAGIGYEFRPHWSVELGTTWGSPAIEEGRDELRTDVFAVHVVVVGTAY